MHTFNPHRALAFSVEAIDGVRARLIFVRPEAWHEMSAVIGEHGWLLGVILPYTYRTRKERIAQVIDFNLDIMAVRVGFEPTEPAKVQRFSRPPDSTTLAPHRNRGNPRGNARKRVSLLYHRLY